MAVALASTPGALAGTLDLRNGDRVEGRFVRVEDGKIVWASRHFGRLSIPQEQVSNIETTTPMKIDGVSTPCLIEGMEDEFLIYICGGDPTQRRVPLASFSNIIPYESFIAGDYSYHGRLNISGNYARGNEIRDDWRLFTSTEYRRADWRHNASLEYASYSRNHGSPEKKWGGRYRIDWFFRERWFWFNDTTLGRDEQRSISHYYTAGSGTGLQVWENQRTALAFTAGLMYLYEAYLAPESPDSDFSSSDERAAWRVGMDFRYRLPLGVNMYHRNELVRSFQETEDWQLTSTTGLSTTLIGQLRSELSLDYNVDNTPQQGRKREDVRMRIGLSYDW